VPGRFAPLTEAPPLLRPDCAEGGRFAFSCDMRFALMLEFVLLRAFSDEFVRAPPALFSEKCEAPAAGVVRAITFRF